MYRNRKRLQRAEKVGRAVYEKDGDTGVGLTYTRYFLVTRGKSFNFILGSVRSFQTDFIMGMT